MFNACVALLISTAATANVEEPPATPHLREASLKLPLTTEAAEGNLQLDAEKQQIKQLIADEILSDRERPEQLPDSSPLESAFEVTDPMISTSSSPESSNQLETPSPSANAISGDGFGSDREANLLLNSVESDIPSLDSLKLSSWPHPSVAEEEFFQAELASEITDALVVNFQVGSNGQKVKLSLETSATWTAIDSNYCDACSYPNYDSSYSETYQQVFSSIQKRDGTSGYVSKDLLKLNGYSYGTSVEAKDFEFLAISSPSYRTKNGTNGYLGMVRPSLRFNSGPLWVGELAADGQIECDMFSFSIGPEGKGSQFFDLGGIDSASLKDSSRVAWIPQVANLMFWFSVQGATAIRIGSGATTNTGLTAEYSFGQFSYPVFFDSGYKLISPPAGVGTEFLSRLLHKKSRYVRTQQKLVLVKCDDDFEDVNLRIEGFWFQVKKSDYLIKTSKVYNGFDCYLAFEYDAASTQKYWTMGRAFMSGYYVIHDNTDPLNAKLGFTPYKDSHKDFITSGELPENNIRDVKDEQVNTTVIDPATPPTPAEEEEWVEDVEVLPESEEGSEVREETSNEIDLDKGLFYYNRPPMRSIWDKVWEFIVSIFGMMFIMPGFLLSAGIVIML